MDDMVAGSHTRRELGSRPGSLSLSLTGHRLPLPASQEASFPRGKTVELTVVARESDQNVTLSGPSGTFRTRVSPRLHEAMYRGRRLKVRYVSDDRGSWLRIQSSHRTQPKRGSSLVQLLRRMGQDVNRETLRRARQYLRNNPSATLKGFHDAVFGGGGDSLKGTASLQSLFEQVRSQLGGSSNASFKAFVDFTNADWARWLRDQGVDPGRVSTDALKTLVDLGEPPSSEWVETLTRWNDLIRDPEGNLDQNRLRSLVFLTRRDIPVNPRLVRDLGEAMERGSWKQSGSFWSPEPSMDRTAVANQVRQFLEEAGFDLERQLSRSPERARDSLRSVLLKIAAGLQTPESGVGTAGVNLSPGDSQHSSRQGLLGEIIRHSLHSLSQKGLVLFVPFEEGGETRMLQIRWQDEREETGSGNQDQWTITLRVNLSRLGPLQIEATRSRDRLSVRLEALQADTVRQLRKRSEFLKEQLSEQGFEVSMRVARRTRPPEDLTAVPGSNPSGHPVRLDLRA